MRFEFTYQNSDRQMVWQWRKEFTSLIDKILRNTNPAIYQQLLFEIKHGIEPFTFSVISYRKKEIYKEDTQNLYTKIIFSSLVPEICVAIYNGLIKLSNLSELRLINVYLHPFIMINDNTAVFKTLSPIILDVKEPDWYLKDDQNDLFKILNLSIQKLSHYLLAQELVIEKFKSLKFAKLAMRYKEDIIQGIEGIFEIQAASEVLNLIHNVGLGIYRGQGFGMLELVKLGK